MDLAEKPDEELMEMYKMGEQLAFEILFLRHSGRVMGFLCKRMRSEKEAQDVLQEAFFKLHRSKHQYDGTLPFSPWLFSIARTVWLDYLKKKKLDASVEHATLELIPSAINESEISENGLDLGLLEVLPPNQKQAISLRVYDDATFEEIASRLATTPENARQLISRGLKRLKNTWNSRKE